MMEIIPLAVPVLTYAFKCLIFSSERAEPFDPNFTVSIQVPTLNEEAWIESSLESLVNQRVYRENRDRVEIVVLDSGSEDLTVEIARNYADRVLTVPKGKLTARNIGSRITDAEVIVSTDADVIAPEFWLDVLLRHFSDPSVAAVTGPSLVYSPPSPLFVNILEIWHAVVGRTTADLRLIGRNSALRREAFLKIGGFNEGINQKSVLQMVREEEIALWRRMSEAGRVIYDPTAFVYTVERRIMPPVDESLTKYREEIGKIRF
ncbi:MAG: hypothetical protein DRP12_00160 [Candidatus Aenigmatarchaeota archaeon]|nr:MAG: hypothetical protein DRP12_00160 [Candidatus Aenigmarchaeota archaeon]